IQSGLRGLAARGRPVALLRQTLDHLVAVHSFSGLREKLRCSVQGAEFLFLGFGLRLRPFGAWLLLGPFSLFGPSQGLRGLLRRHECSFLRDGSSCCITPVVLRTVTYLARGSTSS